MYSTGPIFLVNIPQKKKVSRINFECKIQERKTWKKNGKMWNEKAICRRAPISIWCPDTAEADYFEQDIK